MSYLIEEVLAVRSVSLHDSAHLIDAAVQSPRGYEPRELSIHELYTDPKAVCHVGEGEGTVRLQQLSVSFDTHLSNEVSSMRGKVAITLEVFLHPNCQRERWRDRRRGGERDDFINVQ